MSSKLDDLLVLFEKAVGRLADVLQQEKTEYMRDAAIQRFEFTFELAWKTLKAYLETKGVQVYSPKDSLKEAFQLGLIEEDLVWLKTIEMRNLTSHTYNQSVAEAIYAALPEILARYQALLEALLKDGMEGGRAKKI